jgi:hypothetical protein
VTQHSIGLIVIRPDVRVLDALVEVGVVTEKQRVAVQDVLDRQHREAEDRLERDGRLDRRV